MQAHPDIEVVGQAANGREAVDMAQRLRPDVCLMDLRMPIMDGVEATRELAGPEVDDPIAVVVVTTFDTDDHVADALRAGARGFLLKDSGPEVLVHAIEAAATGNALISPSVTARLLARFADVAAAPARQVAADLTAREQDVVIAVAQGLSNDEIARSLHVSLSTVKFHVSSVMTKISARNRVEIVIWAYQARLVSP